MKTIIGFGSLLSERSARTTSPNLSGFRTARVKGYRRIFNKVGIVFIEKGISDWSTKEVSSVATRKAEHIDILVTVFELPEEDMPQFYEREHKFRYIDVEYEELESGAIGTGIMCTEYSDQAYRQERFQSEKEYYQKVGRFYDGKLWRNDILPCRPYLKHCLAAAQKLSSKFYHNFLDSSFLADGTTSIRQYLKQNPAILKEEHSLKDTRYIV